MLLTPSLFSLLLSLFFFFFFFFSLPLSLSSFPLLPPGSDQKNPRELYKKSAHFYTIIHIAMAAKTPKYINHDGYLVAGGFPVEGFSSGLSYKAKDNDLFICTYPKVRVYDIDL